MRKNKIVTKNDKVSAISIYINMTVSKCKFTLKKKQKKKTETSTVQVIPKNGKGKNN